MFWHCAVIYWNFSLFGGGGSIVWYLIVSYRYTMLILSIVSNHLCLVSPTSTKRLERYIHVLQKEQLICAAYMCSRARDDYGFCGWLWVLWRANYLWIYLFVVLSKFTAARALGCHCSTLLFYWHAFEGKPTLSPYQQSLRVKESPLPKFLSCRSYLHEAIYTSWALAAVNLFSATNKYIHR